MGVILYELCTLKLPFLGSDQYVVGKRICEGKFEAIGGGYSLGLRECVRRLLEVDQDKRPGVKEVLGFGVVKDRVARLGGKNKDKGFGGKGLGGVCGGSGVGLGGRGGIGLGGRGWKAVDAWRGRGKVGRLGLLVGEAEKRALNVVEDKELERIDKELLRKELELLSVRGERQGLELEGKFGLREGSKAPLVALVDDAGPKPANIPKKILEKDFWNLNKGQVSAGCNGLQNSNLTNLKNAQKATRLQMRDDIKRRRLETKNLAHKNPTQDLFQLCNPEISSNFENHHQNLTETLTSDVGLIDINLETITKSKSPLETSSKNYSKLDFSDS